MNKITKILSFTDLAAWQHGDNIVLSIYGILKTLPPEEKYALSDQMKKRAVSMTSNIAEGFSRQSKKEKLQFYYIAKGSLIELQNQLIVARDVHYISNADFVSLVDQTIVVHKLLNGLVKSMNDR